MNTSNIKKILFALGLVSLGGLGTFYALGERGQKDQSQTSSLNIITPANGATRGDEKMGVHPLGDQIMGETKAPVVMVEYASFTCPLCGTFHNSVFPQIKKQFIDTGKVRFIYRDYPTSGAALAISMVTRCIARDVGNDKFFPLIKVLYGKQEGWMASKDVKGEIVKITKLAGYGESKVDVCLQDKAIQKGVKDIQDAAQQKLGVRGTPTLFINGELYKGKNSIEAISQAINAQLN